MTKDEAVKELEEHLRDADKAISEDEEFIRGWKSALLVALEVVHNISLLKEQEAIKLTINEYGEAYCICGENVGIIPNDKNLPSIRSKYCSECGRRMKWE